MIMPMSFHLFLLCAGSIVGFCSGLLGIGGGILMFPLLFYMPPLLGFDLIGVRPDRRQEHYRIDNDAGVFCIVICVIFL